MKDIEVRVIDNDVEKAMRILKKKIQNDGLFKRLKLNTDDARCVKRCEGKDWPLPVLPNTADDRA